MHLIGHRKTTPETLTEKLLEQVTELAERATPHVEAARAKLVDEVLPAAQARAHETAAMARESAVPRAREAYETARLRAEEHLPHKKKPSHKVRNTLFALGFVGAAVAAVRAFFPQERHVPYVPPSPAQAPSSALRTPPSGQHAAGSVNDAGGADPAEALSDQAAGPHPVTTPDAPAEAERLDTLDETPLDQREP